MVFSWVMLLYLVMIFLTAYDYPSYFKIDQRISAEIIVEQTNKVSGDPHFYMAIAWVESRVKTGRVSHTGDYGLFQINYNFWGKKWGYKDRKKFLKDMSNPKHAVVAATIVLNEMKRYKACEGLHLAACYNGGPNWRNSKNIGKILKYANRVNCLAQAYRNKFPDWIK